MSKVFYMPAPDLTGTWAAGDASPEYSEETSVFKFTVADDNRTATFSVCEDMAACRLALGGLRRAWMATVCDSEMFAPPSTKAITTVKVGIADLLWGETGAGWATRNKAEIVFVE